MTLRTRAMILALLFGTAVSDRGFATSGAHFLKIPPSARAASMGGALTAVVADVSAIHTNPAGLSNLAQKEAGVTHAELFMDTRYDFAGFALPLKNRRSSNPDNAWTLGAAVVYLSQGTIEARDENRNKSGSFGASNMSVSLAASHKITSRTSLGLALKIIRENLADENAAGWAADTGIMTVTRKLNLALALLNLGPAMKFVQETYSLPLTFSMGAGYRLKDGLLVSFDYQYRPQEQSSTVGFGSEFALFGSLKLRAGYLSTVAAVNKVSGDKNSFVERMAGLTTGLGVQFHKTQIDYSFTPLGELGASQRITATYKF